MRERFPWARLIVNDDNLGYVGGNNVGIRYALANGADYVFLLNSDTKMTPTCLEELVRVMQADRRIGITGAKNLYMQNADYTWGKYGVLNWGPMLVRTHGRFVRDYPRGFAEGCRLGDRQRLHDEPRGARDGRDLRRRFLSVQRRCRLVRRARAARISGGVCGPAAIYHRRPSADLTQPMVFSYGYFLGRNASSSRASTPTRFSGCGCCSTCRPAS